MSEAERFAAKLAEGLGPLYRISVVDPNGSVLATFGETGGIPREAARIPFPGSDRLLLLEVDEAALHQVLRGVRSLLAQGEARPEASSVAFTHVDRALEELMAMAEATIGKPIAEMSRAEKQSVVRFLDGRGAFAVRKSVETVAEALGVSRFTVYNYLEATREE
jgi:hypothetical protein